ncbi:MAG: hypothetical protein HY064_07575 [Bacteroidetes bacterium]|nr:hypothetical protein [Bacteroidota bacterium]
MKKKIFIAAAILPFFAGCCSEFEIVNDDVPSAVSSAFQTKYPSAQGTEWEVESEDGHMIYEAGFKVDGKRMEAEFKPDGTFIKQE